MGIKTGAGGRHNPPSSPVYVIKRSGQAQTVYETYCFPLQNSIQSPILIFRSRSHQMQLGAKPEWNDNVIQHWRFRWSLEWQLFYGGGGGYFPVMAYRNSCFWLNVYKKHRNLQTRRDNRAKGTLVHWENWGGGRGGAHVPSMPSRFLRLFIWECLWDTKIRDSHKHARTSIYKRAYETPK
jgi:hypothetical protein